MMEGLIRAFIAIELSEQIREQLDAVVRAINSNRSLPVKWVSGKNIHLTLKFLGEQHWDKISALESSLRSEICMMSPFEIIVSGLGAFPNIHRPRVIWVGVQAPQDLNRLHLKVENSARQAGFEAEERPFSPHLTLGRLSQTLSPGQVEVTAQALQKVRVGELGRMTVHSICIFRSTLTPAGAVYTPLSLLPFSC